MTIKRRDAPGSGEGAADSARDGASVGVVVGGLVGVSVGVSVGRGAGVEEGIGVRVGVLIGTGVGTAVLVGVSVGDDESTLQELRSSEIARIETSQWIDRIYQLIRTSLYAIILWKPTILAPNLRSR